MASQAAVVLNGLCSEAVALIGEVVASRWYFLRDKAHVLLYPTADVCGKGQDLSRRQQSTCIQSADKRSPIRPSIC
jgi:hypothetical protein